MAVLSIIAVHVQDLHVLNGGFMKRILLALSFLGIGGTAWAAGNQVSLTVSSGTFQSISTYANGDGANRQAIVVGDVTSSATLTVDRITGIPVSLSTSALTSSGGIRVDPGSSAIPIVSTGAIPASQSGTWTVQPGNTANTTAWKVDGSAVTQPVSGTFWQATQPISGTVTAGVGSNAIGQVNIISTNTLTTSISGTPTVTNGVGSSAIGQVNIISTNTLNTNITNPTVNIVSTNTLNSNITNPTVNVVSTNTLNSNITNPTVNIVSTNTLAVGGNVASGASDSGNPVKIGGIGHTTYQTAVTDGQRADSQFDSEGKAVVMPYAIPALFTSGATAAMTATADTVIISSGGANILTYIDQITCTNSHATVGTVINIKNGQTIFYTAYAVAAGGGFSISLPTPLRGAANTQWAAVNATTGSNTYCSAAGYFAKN